MKRRSFIGAILGAAAAPAIVRAGILMPVKPIWTPSPLAIYPVPGMETIVSDYPRYIKHMGAGAAFMVCSEPVLGCGELSVLLPHQKLPPGWEYCDAQGRVQEHDDADDRAEFEMIMRGIRESATHGA